MSENPLTVYDEHEDALDHQRGVINSVVENRDDQWLDFMERYFQLEPRWQYIIEKEHGDISFKEMFEKYEKGELL